MKRLFPILLILLSLAACAAGPQGHSGERTAADEKPISTPLIPEKDVTEVELIPQENATDTPDNSQETSTDTAGSLLEDTAEAEPISQPAPPGERVIDPSRPMVALTFDDGPHAQFTDQILDILEQHNAVATFFEVATNLHKDPDAVRRAAEMGCEIGNHSYRHANLGKMSLEAIQADLAAADELFIQVLGEAPTLLRPPYGSSNKALKTGADRTLVTWSIDPQDWLVKDAAKVTASIQNTGNLDGQVILLHSIYASTVEATRTLVPWLQEHGYQLVTVSELLTLRFRQEIQTNCLYGYDFFLSQLPPLPEAAAGTPVENAVIAQGDTFLHDGSPVQVRLVMTEGTQLNAAASPVGGGYALGGDNRIGRCALQVWQGEALLSSRDLDEAFSEELLFHTTGFPLCFSDYNSDGNMEICLGQWFSSNANCYVLYSLDETGSLQLVTQPSGVLSSDGKAASPYSAAFEPTADGFAVSVYDNASGQALQAAYRWNPDQEIYLLAA